MSEVVRFHKNSAIIGAVVGLLLGGTGVSVLIGIAPDSQLIKAVAGAFVGGACRPVEKQLSKCEARLLCLNALYGEGKCNQEK